ncbi:tRNA-queuosine alpha-mannosyltransferase isoform X2 [Lissotriton helveticus]
MKPPVRRRMAPLRLAIDPKFLWCRRRCVWMKKEKIRLLRALKAQAPYKELDIEMCKMELPKKTEGEIRHFIRGLKSRVAREAIRKQYKRYQAEKCWGEQILAPIEVWTELAEKVSDKLDDAVTAAFSQILTIAATEPTSLLHSIPTKPTNVPVKKPLFKPESLTNQGSFSSSTSWSPTEQTSPVSCTQSYTESPQASSGDGVKSHEAEQTLDFENIYKYLFELSRGGPGPELSPFESAVVLDLLLSLPKELEQLDCLALRSHMYQSFRNLNMPHQQARKSLGGLTAKVGLGLGSCKRVVEPPSTQREQTKENLQKDSSSSETRRDERTNLIEDPTCHAPSTSHMQPPSSQPSETPTNSDKRASQDNKAPWKDLELCPLNVFMVPLKLMHRVGKDEA